jgi:HK97 gp10 family phage protein
MATYNKVEVTGLSEALAVFDEIADEIGDKKATSKILVPAAREAMKPVLATAKTLAPFQYGDLMRTLQIEARRPSKRDKRSKYINDNDTVIALVTTKAFPKKKRQEFFKENASLYAKDKEAYRKKFKEYAYSLNFPYDARAVAQEFGSASNPPHPFMRPALEINASAVANKLGEIIGRRVEKFRAKNIK